MVATAVTARKVRESAGAEGGGGIGPTGVGAETV